MEIKYFLLKWDSVISRTLWHSPPLDIDPNKKDGGRSQGTKSLYPFEQISMGKMGMYALNFKPGLIQLNSIRPFQPTWFICEVVGF